VAYRIYVSPDSSGSPIRRRSSVAAIAACAVAPVLAAACHMSVIGTGEPLPADGSAPSDATGAPLDAALARGDASTTSSADVRITADGGVNPPDAGPGGDLTQLPCGTAVCSIPLETCCVADLGNSTRAYSCFIGATCPRPKDGDTAGLKCAGAANCPPGTVCCIFEVSHGAASECRVTCSGSNEAQLCDPQAADAGCPSGQPCSNHDIGDWQLPSTYATCGGRGT
jgi:hypothetical protein